MKHMGLRYARTLNDCLLSDRHLPMHEFWIRIYGGEGEDADPNSRSQGSVDMEPCKQTFQKIVLHTRAALHYLRLASYTCNRIATE